MILMIFKVLFQNYMMFFYYSKCFIILDMIQKKNLILEMKTPQY